MMNKQLDRALVEIQKVADSPNLEPKVKERLSGIVDDAKVGRPLDTDKWIYRGVVGSLGLAIICSLSFTFFVALKNGDPQTAIEMPEIFLAIGSAAVGALAGLLAPRPGADTTEP